MSVCIGQGISTCPLPPNRLEVKHPEFMARVKQLKLKVEKPTTTTTAMVSTTTTVSTTSSPEQALTVQTGQLTMHWAALPKDEKAKKLADCHDAWDLFYFVHNVPFHLIGTAEFKHAVEMTKRCPTYRPVCRETLSGGHLDKQDALATEFKSQLLRLQLKYGFVITGDGYKSTTKRQYHNYMLITAMGPVFLGIKDVTGEGGTGVGGAGEPVPSFGGTAAPCNFRC